MKFDKHIGFKSIYWGTIVLPWKTILIFKIDQKLKIPKNMQLSITFKDFVLAYYVWKQPLVFKMFKHIFQNKISNYDLSTQGML